MPRECAATFPNRSAAGAKWQKKGKAVEQKRTYENRRRVRGARGKRLQKVRSELTERTFAHMYETGGMRRLHLRGRENILKRLVVHAAAFNLSILLRTVLQVGKPRQLQGLVACVFLFVIASQELFSLGGLDTETNSRYR
ncbi:MAG TPA: transposase [Bryobacteraceae bacterium]|nr:transposase [Bryobacteraceae bacterium]